MAINLQGKLSESLLAKCKSAGHEIWHENGVAKSTNDVAVQAIIDAHDLLPEYKAAKISEIKTEGLSRIRALFAAITSLDDLEFYSEFWLSIKATSKAATANFQKAIDIYIAAKNAITSVNSATTQVGVNAVVVSWPA